jgi:hypothetical protein
LDLPRIKLEWFGFWGGARKKKSNRKERDKKRKKNFDGWVKMEALIPCGVNGSR